ncbi:hypothetical protein ACH5RR_036709 [Cinchona calisaya]|uniref:CCHC-type domain-containing protein n=1 Tax=Cinchona calisaya TaxID=153742 RepID=A0ABD2Y7U9_9GENT
MATDKYESVLIRFNGKNYSAWAFHFKIFVKGKDLCGHIDGSKPAPDKDKEKDEHAKWEVKDAQIMAWILGSVDPNIILNLQPFKTAAEMWNYLKKLYSQHNTARRFQLEHELATIQQGSLSSVQLVHETTKKDQFLMKLRSEFESTRSSLMNREPVPSLDVCLNALFREEQRILTQSTMEQQRSTSVPMAYVAQGKPKGRDLSTIQCFCCKGFGHYASNCSKKFCNYCKKNGHIIKECPTRPPKKSETAYTVSVGSSSTGNSANIAQSASTTPAPPVTPEMIQQMIISAFSALGLSDSVPSKPLLVYQQHKSNTLDQTSTSHRPPPTHSLTADSVPTATLAPLRRGTRVHKPPDRRTYPSEALAGLPTITAGKSIYSHPTRPTTITCKNNSGAAAVSCGFYSKKKMKSFRCLSALTPELSTTIDKVIASEKVVLFMKGTKDFPQCGFSNTVVQILRSLNVPFETINILENETLRLGLKEYSNWPTFPQLYIAGEFFGGCDITVEAYKNGQLQELLEKALCS